MPGTRRFRMPAQQRIGSLTQELDEQKQVSQRALSQVELLNQQIAALRSQIAAVEAALQASEIKDKSSQTKIADLGRRLNVALAAARAGAEPLPFRLLRPAARDPVGPREYPHRRRPLRLPVGSAVSLGRRRSQPGRQAEMAKLA